MSSYYTRAELEAQRKAQLRRELADSIQQLKKQLQETHDNTAQVTAGENITLSVFATEDSISGYSKNAAITGAMLLEDSARGGSARDELDFSGLLFSMDKKPTKLELELDAWIRKADERPVISEKDEADRARLLAGITRILEETGTDIEDKITSVKMRVSSYLQGAARITKEDEENMMSTYDEYCALCAMLDMQPTERIPCRVEQEVARMASVLEKRMQDEYIMETIEGIMEELGCHAGDDAILDHTPGQMYSVDEHPLCDVFVGHDGSGILFEPVGESKGGSLEKQRQIEDSANSICSLYAALEERAAEKGVILKRVYAEPAHIRDMCVQSDISERSARKKQRKTSARTQKTFHLEG